MKRESILTREELSWTIEHLWAYGDTDIFPTLVEFDFYHDKKDIVIDEIFKRDLAQYKPYSLLDVVVPKSKYGFRPAHLMYPYDSVIFTTAVISIANELEENRQRVAPDVSYSYRFNPSEDHSMFDKTKNFRSWKRDQYINLLLDDEHSEVIITDISDFYQRIYHHRIENLLKDHCTDKKAQKLILSFLKIWRARQSFGLPVGGNASRILAELSLLDTDRLLSDHRVCVWRYVDDFVIFVRKEQNAYSILSMLANHLIANEGLALGAQKTKVLSWEEYSTSFDDESGEDDKSAEESSVERLFAMAYGNEDEDPAALAELHAMDLRAELQKEIEAEYWSIGKIRVILRALRLTGSPQASQFIIDNFRRLLPFAKEVVWLIEDLKKGGDSTFDSIGDMLVELVVSEDLEPLAATRAWLLEIFAQGVIPIDQYHLSKLDNLSGTLDLRQMYRVRNRLGDINFFRQRKTRVHELNTWLQPGFVHGASCLPEDEYKVWVSGIKHQLQFPLAAQFCDWCVEKRNS